LYKDNFGSAGGSFDEWLISDGIRNTFVFAAIANDEHGDVIVVGKIAGDENDTGSEGLSVEQQAISPDSVICKDLSVLEVELSTFLFE
jgi:hypothetical protein